MGTWWQLWGDKGGEERNWPPCLTCQRLKIRFLSNRPLPYVQKYTGLPLLTLKLILPRICQEKTFTFLVLLPFFESETHLYENLPSYSLRFYLGEALGGVRASIQQTKANIPRLKGNLLAMETETNDLLKENDFSARQLPVRILSSTVTYKRFIYCYIR